MRIWALNLFRGFGTEELVSLVHFLKDVLQKNKGNETTKYSWIILFYQLS